MSPPSKISKEQQDRIIENFFDEVGSRVAFKTCSLVSKHWLHLSRTKYFSREKVYLTPVGGPFGFTSSEIGGLQKFLIDSRPKCPLWPYIQRIEICDHSASQFLPSFSSERDVAKFLSLYDHGPVNLASKSLCCAQNLSSLYLWGYNIAKVQDELTEGIQSNSSLSMLHISHSLFNTPSTFLQLLNSLGKRNIEIKLTGVLFHPESKNLPLRFLGDLPTNPTLKLVVNTYNRHDDYFGSLMLFKLILRHRWNVTTLHLAACVLREDVSSSLIPSVVQHIGPSLEELSFPIPTLLEENVFLPPLSLYTCTSLRRLRLGEFYRFRNNEIRKIVESLLSTIQSKEQFRELSVEVSSTWLEDEAKEKVEWDSLEDILLDKERFPGPGPLFILGQDPYGKQAVPLDLVKNVSFPRLADAGNLKSWIYRPPT